MSYTDILIRTLLSVALGGLIGLERQSKHRPAGFRTHILVCLGAMTIMLLSELIFIKYHSQYGISLDPTRLGAQVVSGIGFLGAGTIIHYGANVKGLTTAASLWAVAAVGLVVGAGFYALGITVSVVLYVTLFTFSKISQRISNTGNTMEIIITLLNRPETLGAINMLLGKHSIKIIDMVFLNPAADIGEDDVKSDDIISVRIIFKIEPGASLYELTNGIKLITGVIGVERI